MKTIKILFTLFLITLYWYINGYYVNSFNGVPVEEWDCGNIEYIACIRWDFDFPVIVVASDIWEQDYYNSLHHEYAHILHLNSDRIYIIWEKATKTDVEKYWIDSYPKYVSNYASTNIYEDFAETYMYLKQHWLPKEVNNHKELKLKVVYLLINSEWQR